MRRLIVYAIRLYRVLISPYAGGNCRFHPTCSVYAEEAISRFGVFLGTWMTIRRLGRCHPFHKGGYDPVPKG